MSGQTNLLTISALSKAYSTPALSGVDFDLKAGEVHALVGENGAGKSTLARIISGLTQPDEGAMYLRGAVYAPRSRSEAEGHRVRLVMQELNLIGNLTVAESIFFDRMPHRFGWVDYAALNARARAVMELVGLGRLDPSRPVKSLGVGQQQLIEIAAGISRPCDVLILDEPTAALTEPEVELLFRQINALKQRQAGIIYISHRLEEIQQIADRITVLRDGKIVATRPIAEITPDEVVRLMVGRELGQGLERSRKVDGRVALRVSGLRAEPAVKDVSFEVRRGEILGFAGLMGAGRTETMRVIFGVDPVESGEIYLNGSEEPVRIRSPKQAVLNGIALLTEDRKGQGLLLPLPVRPNITLTGLRALSWCRSWIRRKAESAQARRWIQVLNVRCASVEQTVGQLSGGNQQKVVIAKWLLRDCVVLIFDEPTRGIDVGAKFEIYQLLAKLAEEGKAVVIVSSDLRELLAICDRIVVMSLGRVAGTFTRDDWSQEKIMAAALSGHRKEN